MTENKRLNKRIKVILGIVWVAILSVLVAFSLYDEGIRLPADAFTSANSSSGTYAGGKGAELWDSANAKFNDAVLNDLYEKLFHGQNPKDYIIKNGAEDWENFGKNSPNTAEKDIPYYVVPASIINANVGNPDCGLLLTLDGKEWMATSLTFDKDGNVILTLMQAMGLGSSTAYYYYEKWDYAFVNSNHYDTLKNSDNWSFFRTSEEGGFANKYLVQPKNIQYQQTETIIGRTDSFSHNFINDALGALDSGWISSELTYQPGEIVYDKAYDSWGDEYIWIPSLTETGGNARSTFCSAFDGIWKLTNAQRSLDKSTSPSSDEYCAWLRSFCAETGKDGYCGVGYSDGGPTWGRRAYLSIRPAIHLNLTAAGLPGVSLDNPETVTTTYNGDVQTLKSAHDANPTGVSWYDKDYYEHTPEYVKITTESEPKNAGTYWIKAEITDAWKTAVDAEVDADASKFGWSATQIAAEKAKRSPKFKGSPVTEDGHEESSTVRWFKFVIKPKELTVNKPSYNPETRTFTAPSFANSSELYADAPTLATRFTGAATDGVPYNEIDIVPDRRGTYTAQAILVNSPTDKTEYTGNYVIKNASTINCEVKVNRKRLAILSTDEISKSYSGGDVKFRLTGYDEEWRNHALLVAPSGVRIEGDDTNGWFLVAEDAGTYSITAAIKSESKNDWCWDTDNKTEELIEDKAITITVARKILFVDFISSSGAFLLQKGAEVSFSVQPSNAVDGDDVKISLEYYKPTDNTTAISVPSGILDASMLEEPGTYQLRAVLNDAAAADNKNYILDASMASQNFTVSARQINIESVSWQYTQNNGIPTLIPDSAGGSSGSPAIVVYNGSTFVFSLANSANDLHTAGVKVDTTFGVNGYKNGLQTNATDSAIAITVKLIPYNEEYAFNDANGKPLDEQSAEFTIYVKVDKATIDFSKLVWSADELEYTTQAQQVTVISGLPDFLNVEYYGNDEWNIGEYTAGIGSLRVRDPEAAKNYNVPSSVTGIPTHSWKIVKKKINVMWIDSEESAGDGDTIIFIPTLAEKQDGAIQYRYYGAQDGVTPPTPELGRELTFDDLLNYDQTEYKYYFVCAYIKAPSGSGVREFNSDNTAFIVDGLETAEALQMFRLGGNKNPVIVRLLKDSVVYNGKQQAADIEVDSGGQLGQSDYTITYKEVLGQDGEGNDIYDNPMRNAPTDAGKYIVVVTINKSVSETFAIKGEREFTYTIEKADFDTSEMKWVDVMNGNAEYTGAYIYNPDTAHKLVFVGTPKFDGEEVLGVTVVCTPEVGDGIYTDAGTYKVLLSFNFDSEDLYADNFNIPKNEEFVWEIEKCAPDLSGVTWNYNDKPFVFSIVEGEPVKYSARLVFPEGYEHLQNLIIYNGDSGEYSDAGFHTTGFTVTEDPEILKNYGDIVFSELLERELDWEISPLMIDKATQQQTVKFRAEGYTLKDATNLPLDFAEYFTVKVLDSASAEVAPVDGTWNFFDNGRYRIQITFKRGMNRSVGGTVDNVKWGDNSRGPYQIVFTIEKLLFGIIGWTEDPEGLTVPVLDVGGDSELLAEIEKYFDYVLKQQSDGTELDYATAELEPNSYYTVAIKLKAGFAGNVSVNYEGQETEETAAYGFRTKDPFNVYPTDFCDRPTDKELRVRYKYDGTEKTFELGDWFISAEMEAVGPRTGTEIGEYIVTVGFKSGSFYAWGPEDKWDRNPVVVTFEIYKEENSDRFILTDAAKESHPYKFQYGDFSELSGDISDYVYTPETALYITRLALNDTIAQLLAQFANGESIKVFAVSGTEITDYTKVLMTGIMLRLVDGETVLNQLTVSVLGDVNGDGKINTIDKAQQNSLTLGTKELGAAEKLACDINADGKVNTIDKARLNSQSLGTIDIYEGLRLPAPAAAAAATVFADELDEPTTASVVEPIAEEIAVIAVEEYEPVSESYREMPAREPISATATVVIADTRRLRVKF